MPCFGSLLTAVETNTRSPHTIGLDTATPATGVFHATFSPVAAFHLTAVGLPSAVPAALAPRNDGQFCLDRRRARAGASAVPAARIASARRQRRMTIFPPRAYTTAGGFAPCVSAKPVDLVAVHLERDGDRRADRLERPVSSVATSVSRCAGGRGGRTDRQPRAGRRDRQLVAGRALVGARELREQRRIDLEVLVRLRARLLEQRDHLGLVRRLRRLRARRTGSPREGRRCRG